MEEVFQYIYGSEHKDRAQLKKISQIDSAVTHPFFIKLLEYKNSGPRTLDAENSKCDEIFCEYLTKMANFCNTAFFAKLLKFVTLFRECVNIINREKTKSEGHDFTEATNAEDVPDISNEFITEFLDPDTNTFDISKEEAIDMTQNFCHWLYENNFTCSKLSLISNY
jgi:hypothetical protein